MIIHTKMSKLTKTKQENKPKGNILSLLNKINENIDKNDDKNDDILNDSDEFNNFNKIILNKNKETKKLDKSEEIKCNKQKKCRKCNIEKDIINFSKHSQTADSLDNRCKDCVKEMKKKVKEKFRAEHGFTIAFSPIRPGQELEFTDLRKIFDLLRKYR